MEKSTYEETCVTMTEEEFLEKMGLDPKSEIVFLDHRVYSSSVVIRVRPGGT